MTKRIPLSKGLFSLVDDQDYEWLNQWKWVAAKGGKYAGRGAGGTIVYMHRLITSAPTGLLVDHINGNGLDNRRCNLRLCTNSENLRNQKKPPRHNKTGYKGVSWDKSRQKYEAYIQADKKVHLGRFENIIDAARAYDKAAKKYHGEFAALNFPERVLDLREQIALMKSVTGAS